MGASNSNIKITILGSGTSTGVPMIGCKCKICLSSDERNNRLRSSILITIDGGNILIDTSTDLRYQSLKYNVDSLDAVLFTHHHADHVHGIDELRSFNFIQKKEIDCYGNSKTLGRIKEMFSYIFDGTKSSGGLPRLNMKEVDGPFNLKGETFTPIEVMHGNAKILGYRFSKAAYITDCSGIPEESIRKLEGLDLLILGALRYAPHTKHFSISEALETVERLKPRQTFFTHMGHEIDYTETSAELPEGVDLACDGMVIELRESELVR